MQSVVQKFSHIGATLWVLDKKAALDNLRSSAQNLMTNRHEVEKVVLFGSLADGTAVPGSDADVLLILKHSTEERWFDRISKYIDYFANAGIGVDLFPYTRSEIEKLSLAKQAIGCGVEIA